jgi:probable HAF family extracellular repeat protein
MQRRSVSARALWRTLPAVLPAVLLGVVAVPAAPAAAAPPRPVTVTDLGSFGGSVTVATAVNERGQVVGYSQNADGENRAFLWQNGRLTDLGTLGGPRSHAVAINARGHVVGTSDTADGEEHGFIWRNGRMTDLGTLGGQVSRPTAITETDIVIGHSARVGLGQFRPFVWRRGTMQVIDRPDWFGMNAAAVNDRGQVVGTGIVPNAGGGFDEHGYVWCNGRLTEIAPRVPGGSVRATGIDRNGRVVGTADAEDGNSRAFMLTRGRMTLLGTLGGVRDEPETINERGSMLGWSSAPDTSRHVSLWRNGRIADLGRGIPVDLNDRDDALFVIEVGLGVKQAFVWRRGTVIELPPLAGEREIDAVDLNDRGQVVGTVRADDESLRAVIWQS